MIAESEREAEREAASLAIALLARVRRERPRVHVLTNPVAANISANALLAIGAVPSMTSRPDVVADFVAGARALVVNLGMLDSEREAAIPRAVAVAAERRIRWLLDPVKVERSPVRHRFARQLLGRGPAILRANASEIDVLADGAEEPAVALAERFGGVVVATGEIDTIAAPNRQLRILNGSPLMDRVTAMGCTLSALLGAFLAVADDPFEAAVAGVAVFDVAGELAAGEARGPGSFVPALLDRLFLLDHSDLEGRLTLA
ncbi:Hydroxyethylthiazole kinase [bacterium HR40]|nr:Hydroxyethylthiazole kinase [bacterium HR40]